MYYFNILEPKIICDKAIKFLKQEQTRISTEIGKLKSDKSQNILEKTTKIQELSKLHYEYFILIEELEQLGEFGVEQLLKR